MTGNKKISIDDRKETKLIVLMSVIIFGVIALGLSYAFFEASISKGGLAGDVTCFDIEYLKGGNITGNLKPLDEGEDYITNGAVAQVTMHTTCAGSNLIGTLYFTTEASSTFEFETGYLKYAVVTGGNTVATGSIDGTENQVIYDGFTLNRSATVYKVYFWLDGNYEVVLDKTLSGFIHAEVILESDVKPSQAELTLNHLRSLGFEGTVSETEPTTLLTGATTDEGLFATEDDQGTSYYFRGNVTNNYVKYGKYTEDAYAIYDSTTGTSSYASSCGSATDCTQIASAGDDMYWRIIRINGDGTIRMIYDGTSPHANGASSTNRQIGQSAFNVNYDDNTYVGYMYGQTGEDITYAETHENITDSSIKTTIDRWYLKYLNSSYSSYIANAIYCNDRKIVTDDNKYKMWSEDNSKVAGNGIGSSDTMYGTWNRMESNDNYYNLSEVNPSLKCEQVNDRFTLQGKTITTTDGLGGNQDLTYPVGLITADETILAGSSWNTNENYYLYTGNYYWTGSASDFLGYSAHAFNVYSGGNVSDNGHVYSDRGVRPAISLKVDAIKSGDGTANNPFSMDESVEATLTYLKSLGFEGTVSETEPTTLLTGATTDEGLFAEEDDQGTSYYFRGAVTDNYVKFGKYTEDAYAIYDGTTGLSSYGNSCSSNCTKIASANDDMYWRIIRINGDGTIRMIYDGTSPHENGTSSTNRQIGSSMFDLKYNSNAYVGYMYGQTSVSTYDDTHKNTNNSQVKTTIDRWYSKYLDSNYGGYISNTIYCNDRKVVTDDNKYKMWLNDSTKVAGTGIGSSKTIYGTWNRMESIDNYSTISAINPTLICEQVNDRFTLEGEALETLDGLGGNQKLTYPVGLISADEAVLAGGTKTSNDSYYLYTGNWYWTGTASNFDGTYTNVFGISTSGLVPYDYRVSYKGAVRPVISLKPDTIKFGDGTSDNPFRIEE